MTSILSERRISIASRAVALVIVAAFCFHISRFYLSVELCSHHAPNAHSLQHCKDVVGWLTAPRALLGEISSEQFQIIPTESRIAAPSLVPAAYDVSLPPPFHPPRNIL